MPLADLGLAPLGLSSSVGLTLPGDFGVTFGDPAGKDTVLRSHWSNQATGIAADEVWEIVPRIDWRRPGAESQKPRRLELDTATRSC